VDKRILVVDIPADATAEHAEDLLNTPYAAGYYLRAITFNWPGANWPGGVGARAIFNLCAKPKEPGA